jgi:hypothetical protein
MRTATSSLPCEVVLRAEEITSRGRELIVIRAPGLSPTSAGSVARGDGGAPHPTPAPTAVDLLLLLAVAAVSNDDADP